MILSVAADEKFGIGRNNDLLVFLPEDLAFFKALTVNKAIVIGRKTLESFKNGNPLPKRLNVVLSRTAAYDHERILVMRSVEDLLTWAEGQSDDGVIVAGGGEIYRLLMPYCSKLHITLLEGDYSADTFMPDPTALGFRCVIKEPVMEHDGVRYRHSVWIKDRSEDQNRHLKKKH